MGTSPKISFNNSHPLAKPKGGTEPEYIKLFRSFAPNWNEEKSHGGYYNPTLDTKSESDRQAYRYQQTLSRVDGKLALSLFLPEIKGYDSAVGVRYVIDGDKIYKVKSKVQYKKENTGVDMLLQSTAKELDKKTIGSIDSDGSDTNQVSTDIIKLIGQPDRIIKSKSGETLETSYRDMVALFIMEHIRGVVAKNKHKITEKNSIWQDIPELLKFFKIRHPAINHLLESLNKDKLKIKDGKVSSKIDSLQKVPDKKVKRFSNTYKSFNLESSVYFEPSINNSNSPQIEASKISTERIRYATYASKKDVESIGLIEGDSLREDFIGKTTSLIHKNHYGIDIFKKDLDKAGRKRASGQYSISLNNGTDNSGKPFITIVASTVEEASASRIKLDGKYLVIEGVSKKDSATPATEYGDADKEHTKESFFNYLERELDKKSYTADHTETLKQERLAQYLVGTMAGHAYKKPSDADFSETKWKDQLFKKSVRSIIKMQISESPNEKVIAVYRRSVKDLESFIKSIEEIRRDKTNSAQKLLEVKAVAINEYLTTISDEKDFESLFKIREKMEELIKDRTKNEKAINYYAASMRVFLKNPELVKIFTSKTTRLSMKTGEHRKFIEELMKDKYTNYSAREARNTYRELKRVLGGII